MTATLLCVVLAATPAEPSAPRVTAVVVVPQTPLGARTKKALETALGKTERLTLAPKGKNEAAIARLARRCGSWKVARCAEEVGKTAQATLVLIGRVRGGRAPAVALELVDVASGTVLASNTGPLGKVRADDVGPLLTPLDAALAPPPAAEPEVLALELEPPPPPAPPTPLGADSALEPPAPPSSPSPPPAPSELAPASASALPVPAPSPAQDPAPDPALSQSQSDWQLEEPDATVLHAQAQLEALDGKHEEAKAHLRTALQQAPDARDIAYDLAVLAARHRDERTEADTAFFLGLPPDETLAPLQLAIREALSRRDSAVPVADATALRVQATAAAEDRSPWSARVGLAGQHDTNVTVLPEPDEQGEVTTEAPIAGARLLADAALTFSPMQGDLSFESVLRGSFSSQVTARNDLTGSLESLLDVATGGLSLRLRDKAGAVRWSLEAQSNAVALDAGTDLYMLDGGLKGEWRYELGAVSLGAFLGSSLRDFKVDAAADSDRDGPRSDGGLVAAVKMKRLTATARAGAQWERTQGTAQREAGARGSLSLAAKLGELDASADVAYERRDHYETNRRDRRLTPSARLAYALTDGLSVYAAYALVWNDAKQSAYAYQRNITTAGVQASW